VIVAIREGSIHETPLATVQALVLAVVGPSFDVAQVVIIAADMPPAIIICQHTSRKDRAIIGHSVWASMENQSRAGIEAHQVNQNHCFGGSHRHPAHRRRRGPSRLPQKSRTGRPFCSTSSKIAGRD
jgi:hypothetical protein